MRKVTEDKKSTKRGKNLRDWQGIRFTSNLDLGKVTKVTKVPRNPRDLGIELMAQVRANGRILDHFRVAVGGSEMLKVDKPFNNFFPGKDVPEWNLTISSWPRDIALKRNMTTSLWVDIKDLLASRDAAVHLTDGAVLVDTKDVLEFLDGITDKQANSAAIRWAVGAGEDGRLCLTLQCLPCPAHIFSGSPSSKGKKI